MHKFSIEKRQRRVAGLDETIVYLYAQGQSTRAIQDTLKRLYGAEVSSTLVSTASVLEEVTAWQARPLDRVYPIVYFDALFVKSREEGYGEEVILRHMGSPARDQAACFVVSSHTTQPISRA